MNLSLSEEGDVPVSPPEKFSPIKLTNDVKRVEISTKKSKGKGKSKGGQARTNEGGDETPSEAVRARKELQAHQERVFDLLLQTAAISMYENDNDGENLSTFTPGSGAPLEPGSPTLGEESETDEAAAGISPPVFEAQDHQRQHQRYNNDMAAMFASLESPDAALRLFSAATPFYGSENVIVSSTPSSYQDETVGTTADSPQMQSYGFQLAVDDMMQRDLGSELHERGKTELDVNPTTPSAYSLRYSSPSPGGGASPGFSAPVIAPLQAPMPPPPLPHYAPHYQRTDTSSVLLVDVDFVASQALLKEFGQFLSPLPAGTREPPDLDSTNSDATFEAVLSGIMATHKQLIEKNIINL